MVRSRINSAILKREYGKFGEKMKTRIRNEPNKNDNGSYIPNEATGDME